jgi:hypothetical protein
LKSFHNLRNTRKCIHYISSLITFDMDETNFLLWSTFNLLSFVLFKVHMIQFSVWFFFQHAFVRHFNIGWFPISIWQFEENCIVRTVKKIESYSPLLQTSLVQVVAYLFSWFTKFHGFMILTGTTKIGIQQIKLSIHTSEENYENFIYCILHIFKFVRRKKHTDVYQIFIHGIQEVYILL